LVASSTSRSAAAPAGGGLILGGSTIRDLTLAPVGEAALPEEDPF
jgi:hypothetical protein